MVNFSTQILVNTSRSCLWHRRLVANRGFGWCFSIGANQRRPHCCRDSGRAGRCLVSVWLPAIGQRLRQNFSAGRTLSPFAAVDMSDLFCKQTL